jgi:ribonuclease P protein component
MFKRRFRLSDNKEFQFVYKNGYKAKGAFGMLIGLKNSENFKLGIVVGKKIGNAFKEIV